MFDEREYREVFSQVKASPDTFRRVMTMKNEKKQVRRVPRVLLIAALIGLLAFSVSATETVQNWFVDFFERWGGQELNQQQVDYLEENQMTILDGQTHDGWTVEMASAISDGTTAYVIFHVTGPENMDLTNWTDENGNVLGQFMFGNMSMQGQQENAPQIVTWSEGVYLDNWGISWINDGDGLRNTASLMITLNPSMSRNKIDPFGSEAVYSFRMENIVWEYIDLDYRRELMEGKYAGQSDVSFTPEESLRLYPQDVLAEGVWEFSIAFDAAEKDDTYVELLTDRVKTKATIFRVTGPDMEDFVYEEGIVTLTSVRVKHLTVRFCYTSMHGIPSLELYDGEKYIYPCLVMKDGSILDLRPYGTNGGNGSVTLTAMQPIIFENVDYLLMPDGTIIDMPE